MREIIDELKNVLVAFGCTGVAELEKENQIIVGFKAPACSLKARQVNAVRMLVGGYLSELFFTANDQHIGLYKVCRGMTPNSYRYERLLNCIARVSDDCREEVFVRNDDFFYRYTTTR